MTRRSIAWIGVMAVGVAAGASVRERVEAAAPVVDRVKLSDARTLFFNAHYDAAAAAALELRTSDPDDLAACELRTSALLFELKAALGDQTDREKAFSQCAACPELLSAFMSDTVRGQDLARAQLRAAPDDETALFFLGKLDLNYVWLQLGPLGHRKGWDEYWEARRSLEAVLARNPSLVRARVARAWIDYIVDTKMPRGTRWILGGGNRKRAVLTMQEAADADADFFVHAEAMFALWEIQVRERNVAAAVVSARALAHDFPDNRELVKFLDLHATATR